jgi:maleylacetate reductase
MSVYRQIAIQRVYHAAPFADALAIETAKAARVFVVTTVRQARTPEMARVREILGERFAGAFDGVTSHVPRTCVIAGARAARAAKADLLVAFGGGSVIDAAKVMLLCLWLGVDDESGLAALHPTPPVDPSVWRDLPALRMIALPTTFSAAEASWFGGVTDPVERIKQGFGHAAMVPRAVLYDPALTLSVPPSVLLATGMKAVDHAVERLSGTTAYSFSDALAAEALALLAKSLEAIVADPTDLKSRSDCQQAAWLSMAGLGAGATVGASHAIGHVLGAFGVPHGMTSGATLPAVLRWNFAINGDRQARISATLGETGAPAADAVARLASRLCLPSRLRDLGVEHTALAAIAARAFADPPMRTNPRQPVDAAEVLALLETMW